MTPEERSLLICRIYGRCEEVGDCLEWQGARNPEGTMYLKRRGVSYNIRRLIYEDKHGAIPNGRMVTYGCGNPRCIRHLVAATWSDMSKRLAKQGVMSSMKRRAAVANGRRKTSRLSDEAVAEIRAWDGPVPEIASKHGISDAYAYMLRRNLYRVDFASPWAAILAANDGGRRAA